MSIYSAPVIILASFLGLPQPDLPRLVQDYTLLVCGDDEVREADRHV
jgi:hypothetical protein